jgi:hypothetical protein
MRLTLKQLNLDLQNCKSRSNFGQKETIFTKSKNHLKRHKMKYIQLLANAAIAGSLRYYLNRKNYLKQKKKDKELTSRHREKIDLMNKHHDELLNALSK